MSDVATDVPGSAVVPSEPVRTSGLAVASLVLGITGLCTLGAGAIVGLILGIVGLVKISDSGGKLKGKGLAIAGIVVSGLNLLLLPVLLVAAIALPAFGAARTAAQAAVAMSNVKQLQLAMTGYADDHNGVLPPGDQWTAALAPYLGSGSTVEPGPLSWPGNRGAGRMWAMNARLAGTPAARIRDLTHTVMLFEVDPGGPLAGGPELLAAQPHSPKGYIIGFADGHVDFVPRDQVRTLIWDPAPVTGNGEAKDKPVP
jgi:hypothetical protein